MFFRAEVISLLLLCAILRAKHSAWKNMHLKETHMLNGYDGAASVTVLEDLSGKWIGSNWS